MTYLTERQLRNRAANTQKSVKNRRFLETNKQEARVTIFLSHSHKDKELVEGFVGLLSDLQIYVYVDWQDSTMPSATNRVTAENIKQRICELDYFLILATKDALASRWVPWEIGFADAKKRFDRIAIIPVADQTGRFDGNEYLQIYRRIVISSSNVLSVFKPNQLTGGSRLKNWLR